MQSNGAQTLQDAISEFQNSLTANQRRELQRTTAIPDADAVLIFTAQLDSLNRNRKGRSIASRLHRVLQSVRDFSAVVESFALTHQRTGPLLWGSVKLTMLVRSCTQVYWCCYDADDSRLPSNAPRTMKNSLDSLWILEDSVQHGQNIKRYIQAQLSFREPFAIFMHRLFVAARVQWKSSRVYVS